MMDSLQVSQREYFSISHILSAARMARLAEDIECQFDGKYDEEMDNQCKSYATAAIYGAASFLEATINEIFHDAYAQPLVRFADLTNEQRNRLARYATPYNRAWKRFKRQRHDAYDRAGTHGNEILTKYHFLSDSLEIGDFQESDARFISARKLIHLRNKLTHYEPETVISLSSSGSPPAQLIVAALSEEFSENPFARAGNHMTFPNLLLSAGAAKWAVQKAIGFADGHFTHTGLSVPYEHIRSKITF